MRPRAVFFDFDGTLVDPREGLLDSFVHGLAAVGVAVEDKSALEPLIGPPIRYGLNRHLGLGEPSLSVAVEAFREYLGAKGVLEYETYDGIVDLLEDLTAAGVHIALVTSKPLPFVEQVVTHVGLAVDFAAIAAASLDGSLSEKAELVELALTQLHVDPAEAVMVGDREFDVFGAKAHNVRAVGVLWGYGTRAELEDAGADAVVETVAELRELLLSPS